VEDLLAEEILAGKLQPGSVVEVGMKDGKVVLNPVKQKKKSKKKKELQTA